MKCRACWSEKAYLREVKGWRGAAMSWLGIVPLKCQHCYHKFAVFAPLTWGRQLTPPALKSAIPKRVQPLPRANPADPGDGSGHSRQRAA